MGHAGEIRMHIYTKKRGECPVTRSTSWGLRITRYVRTSNEEAPRNMYTNKVYETIIRISILLGYNEGCTRIYLYTPEDIYDAIVLHISWSLRSFKMARTKRSKRLFIYMKPHSRLPNLLRKRACICVASMQRVRIICDMSPRYRVKNRQRNHENVE